MSSLFILDANVFIEANNRYYAYDLCPGFWVSLLVHHAEARLCSIDWIRHELKDEYMNEWVTTLAPKTFFHSTNDGQTIEQATEDLNWVYSHSQYNSAAKTRFTEGVDPWLIAYAAAGGHTIVTQEQPASGSKREIKIPDVCNQFGVPYVDTFEMLRTLGERFVRTEQPPSGG